MVFTFRDLVTRVLRWTSVACWSNQLPEVLARSFILVELTDLTDKTMIWMHVSNIFAYYLSKLFIRGCIILEKIQYFQFCLVHISTCLLNISCIWLELFTLLLIEYPWWRRPLRCRVAGRPPERWPTRCRHRQALFTKVGHGDKSLH